MTTPPSGPNKWNVSPSHSKVSCNIHHFVAGMPFDEDWAAIVTIDLCVEVFKVRFGDERHDVPRGAGTSQVSLIAVAILFGESLDGRRQPRMRASRPLALVVGGADIHCYGDSSSWCVEGGILMGDRNPEIFVLQSQRGPTDLEGKSNARLREFFREGKNGCMKGRGKLKAKRPLLESATCVGSWCKSPGVVTRTTTWRASVSSGVIWAIPVGTTWGEKRRWENSGFLDAWGILNRYLGATPVEGLGRLRTSDGQTSEQVLLAPGISRWQVGVGSPSAWHAPPTSHSSPASNYY